MESCISLHQRCSSQKGGRLDLSFHPQILPKKTLNLWISETRLHHVCCRFKVWFLWKEYNPCSAQQALRSVSPIWSWDWSSQCTYLTMDSLA
jgi:hypothetical protein